MAPLDRPRQWRHYLRVPDEVPAQAIARALLATGIWEAEISAPEAGGEPYTVIAGRPDVVLTAYPVRHAGDVRTDGLAGFGSRVRRLGNESVSSRGPKLSCGNLLGLPPTGEPGLIRFAAGP